MRILIATDAFPPVCGGSGWSTYELAARPARARPRRVGRAAARRAAGRARAGRTTASASREFGSSAPAVPFVRNYFKNERL